MSFIQDFASNATQGGARLINEFNIQTWKDFRSVLVNKKYGYKVLPRSSDTSVYTKLCTIDLTRSGDSGVNIAFKLVRADNWIDKGQWFADINIRAGIRGLLDGSNGSRKTFVDLTNAKGIFLEQIIAIESQKDKDGYKIEVYFKHLYNEFAMMLMPLVERTSSVRAKIEFTNNQASQETLPTGTQITTTGGSFDFMSFRATWDGTKFNLNKYPGGTHLNTVANPLDNVPFIDTPTYNTTTGHVTFPDTSIIRKPTTSFKVFPMYRNGVVPYIPVQYAISGNPIVFILPDGTIANGTNTPTAVEEMSFLVEMRYEKQAFI